VAATTKRREPPPAVLDFYEPEEVETIASAAANGSHRGAQPANLSAEEIEWRAREDAQDGELFRLAAYTGLRLGELIALRWEDVDFDTRRMVVHRAVSAGVEGPTKSWQARFLPLADPAAEALERLQARGDYTSREDYIFCSRLGRRLDPSAVRRRFKAARDAAELRPLRFHALRHAAGSFIARHADARFVQDVPRALAHHDHRALYACQGEARGSGTGQSGVRGEVIQRPGVPAVQFRDRQVTTRCTLRARYPQPLRWLGARPGPSAGPRLLSLDTVAEVGGVRRDVAPNSAVWR
jgi:integrase